MSRNKEIVEALGSASRAKIESLLADDVEWVEWGDGVPPEGSIKRGRKAFVENYGDDVLQSTITRMTEENDVVVAEGHVRVTKKDGRSFKVQFCNIFELENGKVKRKSSYGVLIKEAA